MEIAAIVFVLAWIFYKLLKGHKCPNCNTYNGATIIKEKDGEHRHCFCCGHWGFATYEQIKYFKARKTK